MSDLGFGESCKAAVEPFRDRLRYKTVPHSVLYPSQESKKTLREELNAVNKSRDNLRAQLREMKSKVGVFSTPQKIDERISALEYDITHNTIDLKQENKVRQTVETSGLCIFLSSDDCRT